MTRPRLPLFVPLSLAAFGAACGQNQAETIRFVSPEQPRGEVRSACPADTITPPPFGLQADANAPDHLNPEVLAQPERGHCEREHYLLAQTEARSRTASTIQTAAGPRLSVHRLHSLAVLPPQQLALLASETGLWAHHAETMSRLARLVPERVIDVVATQSAAHFAYIRQDPPVDGQDQKRQLVVVATAGLAVIRRIDDVPAGRMHLAEDASSVTFAVGDEGVKVYDVRTGTMAGFTPNDTVEDVIPMPGRPGLVAYVGHDNAVAFHDMTTGAEVPQSSTGQLPLVANRDLLTVYWDTTGNRLLAGGADNMLHFYDDMPGRRPVDSQRVRLHGNVVDVVCCVEGHVVAATDSLNVAWIKDGQITRQAGPFLPDAASAQARVGVVGDDTVVAMIGRVFTWTRDGFFVQPDFFAGEEVARVAQRTDSLIVLRSRGWLEFHRFPAAGGLAVESTLLGNADWAIIDATLEAQDDMRVFVGRRHGRMVAAFIPKDGAATIVRGPMVGIVGHPVITPRGDGLHYAVWNLEGQLAELDATTRNFGARYTIEGNRPTSVRVEWAGDKWKVFDEAGAERALTLVVEEVRQSDLH